MKAIMLIVFALGVYADPTFYQRFSASDSPASGRRALLTCLIIWIMFDIILVVTGLMVNVLYPEMPPGEGYVNLVLATLPTGVRALFIVALIGSAISALDGYFLSGAATFANDIYGKLKKNITQKEIVLLTRISIVVFGIVGLLFAFKLPTAQDGVILIGSIWMSAGFAPIVGALLIKTKKTPMGGYLSMFVGAGIFIYLKINPIEGIEPLVLAVPISFVAWFVGNKFGQSIESVHPVQKEKG
jgi:SSS family solute:Na+ symporter